MSYFTKGGPGKEYGTNKPPPTGRIQERSKGDSTCLTNLPESSSLESPWLSDVHTTRKEPESRWLARDNLETNSITIKPKAVSHVAEQFSWVHLPCCSHSAQARLPSEVSCFVSTSVCSDNSFPSVRQQPTLGPWKGGRPQLPAIILYCVKAFS